MKTIYNYKQSLMEASPTHTHVITFVSGVSISALWPATVIQAHVTDVLNVPLTHMRKPDIFADAVLGIVNEPTDK